MENYYNDFDLNVAMISNHFNGTSSYLSSTFKKNMNMGLLEYITTVRLSKAKSLIVNTDDTFETISAKVGISNVRTFFRLFQKYVGMSPGKYRETNVNHPES